MQWKILGTPLLSGENGVPLSCPERGVSLVLSRGPPPLSRTGRWTGPGGTPPLTGPVTGPWTEPGGTNELHVTYFLTILFDLI